MSTSPILWVAFVIGLAALTIWIVQLVRSRRDRGDGRGPWWQGPWDEDDHR
ncbi:hypothetical protein GCM10025768_04560 [Microbacterium pseudoresistens]|uniref:Uncharacterized protein n=1 Tax=Microbacterium pseudoresistens TaxID=640634 RepID=A0A7Y9JM06_9MICO|nr:hypothetical protein [Microbacterium pseudoresistens]NYD54292.1 hypothetical protein [Microbacterium pseudoresistens]